MDSKTLAAAMGIPLARADKWAPAITSGMAWGEINKRFRICSFLAQIGHESEGLIYVAELGNDKYLSKYDTGKLAAQLGNTPAADGDGQLYKGRGLIQVTGRANYASCSKALFGDDRLLRKPDLLEQPEWAVKSAVWYWDSRKLNDLADAEQFERITIRINGGLNGFEDRQIRYRRALSVIQ